jgi:hypothetical protein
MPSVSQRTVRTTQPQTAVGIDYSNPITHGLVACLDANRRVLINGSETRPLTLTNPARRASQQEFGSTTYQATMQAIKAPPAASSNVTMLSLFIPSTDTAERAYGQLGHIATGNMFSVASGDGTTAGVVRFKIYLGSTRIIGASQANAGVPNLAIARHINGQSQNLWLNGVKDAASGTFTGNSLGFGFYGFNQSSGTGGTSILNAVWNRALTDAEIKSLSENPWQIFAPERRVVAFDVVAPSGGAVDLVGQNSQQANTVTNGQIIQSHVLIGSNSNQANISTSGEISTGSVVVLSAQNSQQANFSTGGEITQSEGVVDISTIGGGFYPAKKKPATKKKPEKNTRQEIEDVIEKAFSEKLDDKKQKEDTQPIQDETKHRDLEIMLASQQKKIIELQKKIEQQQQKYDDLLDENQALMLFI